MNLEQNIKGLCSKNGIHFQDFLSDFNVESVKELSIFDLEAICDEYQISMESLLFKSLIIESELRKKLDHIKLLILDVDGVMTDGGMLFTANGDEQKKFNTKDGMAVKMLYQNGYHVGLISHSKITEMVTERANMLNIKHCYVGSDDKLTILKKWISELGISLEEVAFLGDDNNDNNVMEHVGVSVCPSDSSKRILNKADIILERKGGDACLREFVEEHLGLE